MKIIILGSGTGIPHPERAAPGFWVNCSGRSMLVDPGAGSLHRLERFGVAYRDLDAVLFSHYHPDHIGDLTSLLFALRIDSKAPKGLRLIGPPGLERLLDGLASLHGDWVDRVRAGLNVIEEETPGWTDPELELELTSIKVEHAPGAVGYRWRDRRGTVLAYSGDTDACPGLLDLLEKADLALVEASHPHDLKVAGHLSGLLAGRSAAQAEVARMVILHRYPECDAAPFEAEIRSGGFRGRLDLASDGMKITF